MTNNLDTLSEETTALAELQNSWDGTFFFEVSTPHKPDAMFVDMLGFDRKNVFEELDSLLVDYRVYFDPAKYKVCVAGDGAELLLDDLIKSSRQQMTELVRRDKKTTKIGMRSWKLSCASFRQYVSNVEEPRDVLGFRPSLIRGDRRRGSRGAIEGVKGSRRTNTNRSTLKGNVCKFSLTIYEGNQGFFLKIDSRKTSSGNCCHHTGHIRNTGLDGIKTTRLNDMTNLQKKVVQKLLTSGIGYSATCNAMKFNEGIKMKHHHMRFIYQNLICGDETDDPKQTKDAGEVIRGLVKEKHDFVTLFQHKAGAGATCEFACGSGATTQKNFGPPGQEFQEYLDQKRSREELSDDQPLLLAVLWATAEERALFEKYPNVVKIDTTFGTNKNGLPLVVLSGKTSNNETFTIARGNLPNERAFVFKWLFEDALPALFPSKLLGRVQLIISDGDSQEIVQISAAVSPGGSLEFALRLQCVFHIVDRSWKSKVYNQDVKQMELNKNRFYEPIRKLLMHWIYSWCTASCETKEEYLLSNELLKNYMSSKFFKERIKHYFERVQVWFVAVEATVGLCLFYKRNQVVGLEEYTNSSAESNFSAMKHGYSNVHKKMSLARSNFHLNVQAGVRTQKIRDKAIADLSRSCVWSQIPELTSHLSTYGAGLLETAYNKRFDYHSRCDGTTFLVAPMSDVDDVFYSDYSLPFVPIFRRVRTLRLEMDEVGRRVLTCDCFEPSRTMMVCRHQMHIIDKYFHLSDVKYTSLVHPNWWATYSVYAYPSKVKEEPPGTSELRRKLEAIASEYDRVGYRGPNLQDQSIGIASNDECHHFAILPAHECCVNWDIADLELISPYLCQTSTERHSSRSTIFGGTATYTEPLLGMSQTSVIFDGGGDGDSDSDQSDSVKQTRIWQRRYDKLVIETRKRQAAMKTGAFQILNPMFKELVSVLERFPKRINDRVKNFEWMIADTEKDNTGDEMDGLSMDDRARKRQKGDKSEDGE
jgi:hypothetical protein